MAVEPEKLSFNGGTFAAVGPKEAVKDFRDIAGGMVDCFGVVTRGDVLFDGLNISGIFPERREAQS